jgi:hypothetical protein
MSILLFVTWRMQLSSLQRIKVVDKAELAEIRAIRKARAQAQTRLEINIFIAARQLYSSCFLQAKAVANQETLSQADSPKLFLKNISRSLCMGEA